MTSKRKKRREKEKRNQCLAPSTCTFVHLVSHSPLSNSSERFTVKMSVRSWEEFLLEYSWSRAA